MNTPKADHETGNPLVVDAACGAGLSGAQRARIIWPSFGASSGDPSTGPVGELRSSRSGQAHPATYHLGTPRDQSRGTVGRLARGTSIFVAS